MPTLYILAGPNGAGKTTWYDTAAEQGFIEPSLSFINVDVITAKELGSYTEENFVIAASLARERIASHIERRANFMIESNLAKSAEYDWVQLMINNGYKPVLYFICTDDLDINKNRVKKRVKEGGHDIAESIIEHRYKVGLTYLKSKILLFEEAYLIDNSQETPKVFAILKAGKIIQYEENAPVWVKEVMFIVHRLQK